MPTPFYKHMNYPSLLWLKVKCLQTADLFQQSTLAPLTSFLPVLCSFSSHDPGLPASLLVLQQAGAAGPRKFLHLFLLPRLLWLQISTWPPPVVLKRGIGLEVLFILRTAQVCSKTTVKMLVPPLYLRALVRLFVMKDPTYSLRPHTTIPCTNSLLNHHF